MAKHIYIENTDLNRDKKSTFLSADASSGSGTIDVDSIIGFSTDQILLIGEFGIEESEIINVHASTSPSGSTVTLASNLAFNHDQGTKVYIIDYDQVEISHASTTTGSKTVLDTIDIQADQLETTYKDTTKSSGYYFTRFKDSVDSQYSSYGDPIPYTGYASNSVKFTIDYALKRTNKGEFTDRVDHQFCLDEINSCLRYIHGKLKKWHRLQEFDYVLGQTEQSEWKFSIPTNAWGYSNKSILDIHLEGEESLIYKDEREWNEMLEGVVEDSLSSSASAGDTSITLNSSYSFDDDGTVLIEGQEIDYDTNTRSTGVLSGIPASGDGAITSSLSSGDTVWQGDYNEGNPKYYNIKEEYIYIYPIPDSSYNNINLMADYWKEAPTIDSDNDTLDIMRFDMVKHWLVWACRSELENEGKRNIKDGAYIQFKDILRDAIKMELRTHGQEFSTKPKINKIIY